MSEDVDRIMAVMAAAFDPHWGEAWTRRQVEDSLLLPTTRYLLVDAAGRRPEAGRAAAGFALLRALPEEDELLLIAVNPDQRGRGLGRLLLDRAVQSARDHGALRLFLEMRQNNPAMHLYRAAGFAQVGQRPAYYRLADGTRLDALTMALELH